MKVKFKKGFSLNGVWFEKDEIKEFDEATAKALIGRGVVAEHKEKATTKTDKNKG
jgi:hypothetical protein